MSELHSHEWDEEFLCTICDRNAIWAYEQAEAERDELRGALRDLREYIYWPDRAAAHVGEEALRTRIDALIGPYGEQGT